VEERYQLDRTIAAYYRLYRSLSGRGESPGVREYATPG
jgi:hypothetical protein